MLNPLDHPICLESPKRLTPFSAWHEHIPFAMFLTGLVKPRNIVELGTYYGDSYCAFCQAVKSLNLNTRCYAIDTWQGDPHTGLFGPEVLAGLRAHHDPLYQSFSKLIQSTFDEALRRFADGTIDILHIDGYHTYKQVKHNFESWLPKMSTRGIVLLHDTSVRKRDFGVRRFWTKIKSRYPHFEFLHCYGLGVLAVGKVHSEGLRELFDATGEDMVRIRSFFSQLGRGLAFGAKFEARERALHDLRTRLSRNKIARQLRRAAEYTKKLEGEVEAKKKKLEEVAEYTKKLARQIQTETTARKQAAEYSRKLEQQLQAEATERGKAAQYTKKLEGEVEAKKKKLEEVAEYTKEINARLSEKETAIKDLEIYVRGLRNFVESEKLESEKKSLELQNVRDHLARVEALARDKDAELMKATECVRDLELTVATKDGELQKLTAYVRKLEAELAGKSEKRVDSPD